MENINTLTLILLVLAFLFFVGSMMGWCLELFYRRFFSNNNPERKWINPGFLVGPYLPLYGFGLCANLNNIANQYKTPAHIVPGLFISIHINLV